MGIKFVKLVHAVNTGAVLAPIWSRADEFHVNPAHVTTVAQVAEPTEELPSDYVNNPVTFVNIIGTAGYYVWGSAAEIVNKLA